MVKDPVNLSVNLTLAGLVEDKLYPGELEAAALRAKVAPDPHDFCRALIPILPRSESRFWLLHSDFDARFLVAGERCPQAGFRV
jgi:hypothetical protein